MASDASFESEGTTHQPPRDRPGARGCSRRQFLIGAGMLGTAGFLSATSFPGTLQKALAAASGSAGSFDYPVLTSKLLEAGFETGSIQDLQQMQERETPRYGDPVRQPPEDPDELIDPRTLAFSLAPTEDPTVYRDTMEPLLDVLEQETGKRVKFFPLNSYAAQVEAMRSERLHVAGFSTGTVPFAVNIAGAVPFSIQVSADGKFGYRLWLITQADNDSIQDIHDLKGKTVAHTEPTSNSGNLAPRAVFAEQGVEPGTDYEVVYSGGHQQSALGVFHGDYDAAPVCSTCYARVARADQLDPSRVKCIFASRPFPTTGFCYRYNLVPELRQGIRNAFLEYDYSGTKLAEQFEGRGQWIEIDYATAWDIILTIQEANNVQYKKGQIEG